jgi:hypothetical protein
MTVPPESSVSTFFAKSLLLSTDRSRPRRVRLDRSSQEPA